LVARVAALIKKLTRPAPIRSTIMEDVKFDFRKLADPGVSWRLAPAG
jgi:hypothetical protein